MLKSSSFTRLLSTTQRRLLSDSTKNSKRYLQTINQSINNGTYTYVPMDIDRTAPKTSLNNSNNNNSTSLNGNSTWSRHSLNKSALNNDVKPQEAPKPLKRRKRQLKPRKALITLTPNAVSHLKSILDQPNPQYIKVGVKNRGCSGLSYNLEYVSKPEKFDEVVELEGGLKIIIDSKALFSIIGSEMDYVDDKLSSRFVFNNPNAKGSCGCGESFMV